MDRNSMSKRSNRNTQFHRKRKIVILVVALILLAGVSAGIIVIMNTHKSNTNILTSEKFYNVIVDDISISGLTHKEAKQQIEAKQKEYVKNTGVTITKDTQSWQYKIDETSYSFDTDEILDEAWKQGRTGSDSERLAAIEQLSQNPVKLKTTISIEPSVLEQKIRELALPFTKQPVDATYLGYDANKPDGERLSFTPEIPGEKVDADALWVSVQKEFVDKTFGSVNMQIVPVDAAMKVQDLQAKLQLIVKWRSEIKDHSAPRLTNIELASAAINGKMLMPGDELSFNDSTGERTEAKGYQIAHIINAGVVDNGLAGGTCQVSGTLWNAVVRADLEITQRLNHTLKSTYLNPGEDATVDYGRKDFKFKNNKTDSILLIMYVSKEKSKYYLYAEVYGVPLEPGMTIKLESVLTKTVPAPIGEPKYVPSEAVEPGKTETNKPKDGEYYTTYKIYMKDGKEINRVKQHESYYPASGLVIVYNPLDGMPTVSPTISPSPTPQPTMSVTPTPSETITP